MSTSVPAEDIPRFVPYSTPIVAQTLWRLERARLAECSEHPRHGAHLHRGCGTRSRPARGKPPTVQVYHQHADGSVGVLLCDMCQECVCAGCSPCAMAAVTPDPD